MGSTNRLWHGLWQFGMRVPTQFQEFLESEYFQYHQAVLWARMLEFRQSQVRGAEAERRVVAELVKKKPELVTLGDVMDEIQKNSTQMSARELYDLCSESRDFLAVAWPSVEAVINTGVQRTPAIPCTL